MKKLIYIFILVLLASCANMGLYDNTKMCDDKGNEYVLKYAYGGYYFLEIKDDSGNYIPDNRYERLKKRELKKEK